MEVLFIWLAFGVVNAVVASHKGRDAVGWFILGVLFSFFSTIVLLVLSPYVPKTYVQVGDKWVDAATVQPYTKPCPDCGETVLKVANVCKHCGYRFGPAIAEAAPLDANPRNWQRPY